MTDSPRVEWLLDEKFRLGESPVWDARDNRLYWVDIPAGQVHSLELASKRKRQWQFEGPVGSMGLTESGKLIFAVGGSVHLFDPVRESLSLLAILEKDYPKLRLNDGKVGPDQAFWVGSMDDRPQKEEIGSLYRVTADGKAERKIQGLKVSNGLAWSPDGRTMFHSDSRGPWIDRWEFDAKTGAISERRRIRTLTNEEGRPDGAACDAEGCYWSCGVSAGRLNRFDANGKLLHSITVPVPAPTMLCFGGADLRTAFVTSLREGLADRDFSADPHAGKIFSIDLGVAGTPIQRFAD
jgi:sugar lactone lactonase YvrE